MKRSTGLKKCKICGEKFKQYNTVQNKCPQCQIKEFYSHKKPKCKPLKINKPKKKRVRSENSKWKDKAWKAFSAYIRIRDCLKTTKTTDRGKCYTCDKIVNYKESQAGHGISGRGNSILLDESIVKLQCIQCNILKGGNYEVFVSKLIAEHGEEWYQNKLNLKHTPMKKNWKEEYEYWNGKYQELICSKNLPF